MRRSFITWSRPNFNYRARTRLEMIFWAAPKGPMGRMFLRMKLPKHTERSQRILTRIANWGFPDDVLQRIGALALVWAQFESNLETAVWALRGDAIAGKRPWTDKTSVSDWIKELGKPRSQFSVPVQQILQMASLTALDLMDYRHAVVHGVMLPSSTMPTFIRNPGWHGEVRRRPSHDAHVDRNLLDMAIDSAWALCQVVVAARAACTDPEKIAGIAALKLDVSRARSMASELRHLTALMNDDKY